MVSDQGIIIIGASAAGIAAAKEIRSCNDSIAVTLLTEEQPLPYYRPFLTELIGDAAVEKKTTFFLSKESWFEENRVGLMRGVRVTEIDRAAKTVTTDAGQVHAYQKLILATGGFPFVPDPAVLQLENVITVRTYDDAHRVNRYSDAIKRVVVIGGGLLGLEAAYSLKKRGLEVTIVEVAERVLPRQLDVEGSRVLAAIISDAGVHLRCGQTVKKVTGSTKADGVTLETGEHIPADMVIYSIGIRPNTSLAASCGLTVNRAVVVDEHMCTSDRDIYACGDVTEFNGKCLALWMPAVKQGKVAGINAAGGDAVFSDEAYPAVLNSFGTKVYSTGDICNQSGANDFRELASVDLEKKYYRKLFFTNGHLSGFILIGDIAESQKLATALKSGLSYDDASR